MCSRWWSQKVVIALGIGALDECDYFPTAYACSADSLSSASGSSFFLTHSIYLLLWSSVWGLGQTKLLLFFRLQSGG